MPNETWQDGPDVQRNLVPGDLAVPSAMAGNDETTDMIARLVPAVLRALHALEFTSRHLSPNALPELINAIRRRDDDLPAALAASRALVWPERLGPVRDCLERAGDTAREGLAAFVLSLEAEQPMLAAYRSLRG